MSRQAATWLGALLAAIVLSGCGSTAGIPASETYSGQVAAAIAPVGGVSARWQGKLIQRGLATELDRKGVFADVIPLEGSRDGHEAEIVLLPSMLERSGDRLRLRVRAREQSNGKLGLDKTYKGRGAEIETAANDIGRDLAKDLKRRYGKKPVL